MSKLIGVYGASGFGREVMPLIRQQYGSGNPQIVFIDDNPSSEESNGNKVLTYSEFQGATALQKSVVIAIADSAIRRILTRKCIEDGIAIADVFAESAVCLDRVDLGEGSIICPFVTLTSNIQVGKSFQANLYSYVAHDCVIGDFVTFAPGVKCNGNVVVEDGAYIGTGAIIKQGTPGKPLTIGAESIVGMGAVVTKDVPPGVTVIGNPARIL